MTDGPTVPAGPLQEPPHSVEAEQALLGAIMANQRVYDAVSAFLEAKHFYFPVHGAVYAACGFLLTAGGVANPVTLKAHFEGTGELETVGGTTYLARLAASVVTIINATSYARHIKNLFLLREIIAITSEYRERAAAAAIDETAPALIEGLESAIFRLTSGRDGNDDGRGVEPVGEVATRAMRTIEVAYETHGEGIGGVRTGLTDLDRTIGGGLRPTSLYILAGRPSMGKTALGLNIAKNAAKLGTPTLFFSLEMSSEQLVNRLQAGQTGVSVPSMMNGNIERGDLTYLVDATNWIGGLPLWIDETSNLNVAQIRQRARRAVRLHKIGLIVVDYLGRMAPEPEHLKLNKVHQVEEMAKGLKTIARQLNVPVLVLAQLSRGVEGREDKRPTLSDLRDSGGIEQEADLVAFIYREEYYLERSEPAPRPGETAEKVGLRHEAWKSRLDAMRGVAEILVPKNRQGPTGMVKLHFDAVRMTFSGLATDREVR